MKSIILFLLVELAVLHQTTASLDYGSLQTSLASNMALWKSRANGWSAYRFTYRADGFLPVDIQVIDSKVTCYVYNGSSYSQSNTIDINRIMTIAKLFSEIGEAIAQKYCLINVTYDKALGYPSSSTIDSDCGITDIPSLNVSDVRGGIDRSLCGGTAAIVITEPVTDLVTEPIIEHSEPGHRNDYAQLQASLTSNMALWSSNLKSSQSYTMTYEMSCFCREEYNQPVDEQVVNSEVKCAMYSRGSKFCGRRAKYSTTVEKLFSIIKDAIQKQYCQIEVSYDESLGYPSFVTVASDCGISDIPSHSVSNVRIGADHRFCHRRHGHRKLWYIIGGVTGFVLVAATITVAAVWRYRRRRSAVITKKVGNIHYVNVQNGTINTEPASEKVLVV